jgi:hypothetical protein
MDSKNLLGARGQQPVATVQATSIVMVANQQQIVADGTLCSCFDDMETCLCEWLHLLLSSHK